MHYNDLEDNVEDFNNDIVFKKNEEKIKEKLLDEIFKKAEVSKGLRKEERKTQKKKPFPKSGIVLIITAIICITLINHVPWLYIKYDSQSVEDGTIEEFYYRDFINKEGHYYTEVDTLFEPLDHSFYTGLSMDDFTVTPRVMYYMFLFLILVGVASIVFHLINRFGKYSFEKSAITQSIFAMVTCIAGIYLVLLLMKFLGVYLLLCYNSSFILQSLPNIMLFFPAPIILFIITLGIIKTSFSLIRMNFRALEKSLEPDISKESLYVYRGSLR